MRDLKDFIEERTFAWQAWRHHFHAHPELSEEEKETEDFIVNLLEDMEISCYQTSNGGIVADIPGEEPGPVVALRADMDALPIGEEVPLPFRSREPGVMHACGHDVHTAVLLGVCDYFSSHPLKRGHVKCFFQPAEETVGGAEVMVQEGVMENPKVDRVLGLHVDPGLPAGEVAVTQGIVNANTDEFTLTITGKSGHGAHPDSGVDGILIAAQCISALHHLTGRVLDPLDPAVITVGTIHGGNKANILAEKVECQGTLRTVDEEVRRTLMERMENTMDHVAASYGGKGEILWEPGYVLLENDDAMVDDFRRLAGELLGAEKVKFYRKPSLGGDDFAYFAKAAPGLYYNLGSGFPGRENPPIHSSKFEVNEDCIPLGVFLQLSLVFHYLGIS